MQQTWAGQVYGEENPIMFSDEYDQLEAIQVLKIYGCFLISSFCLVTVKVAHN